MARITRHMVQPFKDSPYGLEPGEAHRAETEDEAVTLAARLACEFPGVLAFTWHGDPGLGEEGRVKLLAKHGMVPRFVLESMGVA